MHDIAENLTEKETQNIEEENFGDINRINDNNNIRINDILDPNNKTYEEILNHPWLKKDNNYKKYKLFTKAERIMLEKNYIDYRIKGNDDLKESFTISNLDSNDKNKDYNIKNVKTKSTILAPYNTLIENESFRINSKGEAEFDNGEKFNDFNNNKIKLKEKEGEILFNMSIKDSIDNYSNY